MMGQLLDLSSLLSFSFLAHGSSSSSSKNAFSSSVSFIRFAFYWKSGPTPYLRTALHACLGQRGTRLLG